MSKFRAIGQVGYIKGMHAFRWIFCCKMVIVLHLFLVFLSSESSAEKLPSFVPLLQNLALRPRIRDVVILSDIDPDIACTARTLSHSLAHHVGIMVSFCNMQQNLTSTILVGVHRVAVLQILRSEANIYPLLQQITQMNLFTSAFSWTFIFLPRNHALKSSTSEEKFIRNKFNSLLAFIESDITVAIITNPEFANMYSVYRAGVNSEAPLSVSFLGVCGSKENRCMLIDSNIVQRRKDLCGSEVIVAGVSDPDYDYDTEMEFSNNQWSFKSGFAVDILHNLQQFLNFSVVAVKTSYWGHLENYSWQGMIPLLQNGSVDLAISSTAQTFERNQVVQFTHPTSSLQLAAYVRQPRASSVHNVLILPFTLTLWLCGTGLLIVLGFSLFIGSYQQEKKWREHPRPSLSEALLWAFSTVCQQGWSCTPHSCSLRTVFMVGYCTGILLYTAYSASLVSVLSVNPLPIGSLEDLAATQIQIGVHNYPVTHETMQQSSLKVARTLYKRYLSHPNTGLMTISYSMEKVSQKRFAFFVDNFAGRKAMQEQPVEIACQITELIVPYTLQRQGAMLKKNSPLRKIINYSLLRMQEAGIINQRKQQWLLQMPQCHKIQKYYSVEVDDLYTAFLLLAAGIGLSIIMLGCERLYSKLTK